MIYYWSQNVTPQNTVQFTGISRKSVIQIFAFLREIFSKQIIDNPSPLGGPGRIVQINECLFRHKPKYHRGRHPRADAWVFGMVDTSTTPSRGYMELDSDKRAASLLPIIQRNVLQGIIFRCDM